MNAVADLPAPYARILKCTEAEYFADPCAVPSLSQSIATTLVSVSPLHAWAKHPRLGNCEPLDPTAALDAGKVMHKLLLGAGAEVDVVEAKDWRTKVAQEARDNAYLNGRIPMLREAYDNAVACAAATRTGLARAGVNLDEFDAAEPEVAIEWTEPGQYGDVVCRGKLDKLLLGENDAVIFDVKKSRDAHPRVLGRRMIEYGYDIQHAAYTRAVQALRPDLAGRIRFLFLFLEDAPPYAVLPAVPDGPMRAHGEMRWERAVRTWERCLRSNVWPGYSAGPVSLEAPAWALAQEYEIDG